MCSEDLTLLCITQSDRNARDRIWPGVGGHVTLPYVITPELGQLEASLFFKCLIACFFFLVQMFTHILFLSSSQD